MRVQNEQLQVPLDKFANDYKAERDWLNNQVKIFDDNKKSFIASLQNSLESIFDIKPETRVVVTYISHLGISTFGQEKTINAYYTGLSMTVDSPALKFNKVRKDGGMANLPDSRSIPIQDVISIVKA